MISSFWVSFGLLMGVIVIHMAVPPFSTLLRLPPLPSNWITGAIGLMLGSGRFWTLFIAVNTLSFSGEASLIPTGWFGHATFTFIGLITLVIYMAWMSAVTGERRNLRTATIMAGAYFTLIILETWYVYQVLY